MTLNHVISRFVLCASKEKSWGNATFSVTLHE